MENKLISMTDFVLQANNEIDHVLDCNETIRKYAEFLKQPLTLGMFVPCDEEGNVLEEPQGYVWQNNSTYGSFPLAEQFQKAKERVLFEGFMNVDTGKEGQIYFALKQSHRKNNIDYIMNDAFGLFFYNSSNEKSRLNTIEDLLNFHELILTESALKQIQS